MPQPDLWLSADGNRPAASDPDLMRILLDLGGNPPLHHGIDATAASMAAVAGEHEVIVSHAFGPQVGHMLELALRNALPERDVVSVLTQVVIAGDGYISPERNGHSQLVQSSEPQAIAEIRSLRALLDSGALVICAHGDSSPVTLTKTGELEEADAVIDQDRVAALLARRLDADLLLLLTDGETSSYESKLEAAGSFAEATGRRAAIGALSDVARVVRGETGTQIPASAFPPAITAARRA